MARGVDEFHKHKPRDISPQGAGSGLNADTIQGQLPIDLVNSAVISNPPAGKEKINNFFWDPETQELVIITGGGGGLFSLPPIGKKKVTNFYWDQATQEIVIDVED